MSKDKAEQGDKPAKGKGMIVMLIVAVAMLALGGGGAFALVKAGVIGGEKKHEDNSPKLVRKGEVDPYAPKAEGDKDAGSADVEGEGGSRYRTAYYSFSDEFTSNLRDSASLIQVSLACSTQRDGRVLMWLKKHELAIRSAMLAVLADTPETDINTIQGKERLQRRLAAAINKVLIANEGFGGVDNVYFKNFLVQ
jgi:flagellar FliL protein